MAIYNADGTPHYLRIYDAPNFVDRYTVVFTGRFKYVKQWYPYRAMSEGPCQPQGFGQWGENHYYQIDRLKGTVSGKHLGKRIKFETLPEDCQKLVRDDYRELWGK